MICCPIKRYYQIQPFNRGPVKIVADVESDLEVRIREVRGSIVKALPSIEADPTQMRQLMQNLIGARSSFTVKIHRRL